MHSVDAATGRASTFDASRLAFVRAADARGVFGADNQLNVVALDVPTGQSRTVAQSSSWPVGSATRNLPGVVRLWQAEYALDADYLYVAWRPDPAVYNYLSQGDHVRSVKGSHDIGDLARVKRDGSGAPEYLGKGPDGRFLVSDGFAYWGSRYEGLKRRNLVPDAANELVWAAPDVPYIWPIGLSAGRFYFSVIAGTGTPRTFAVESVPLTGADGGAAQPRVHVASAPAPFVDAVVDGVCVYSAGPGGVVRANLDDGTLQPLAEGHPVAGDATIFGSRFLATDGRFLYWADYGGDLVVRWKR
jgi:hypothetical protein